VFSCQFEEIVIMVRSFSLWMAFAVLLACPTSNLWASTLKTQDHPLPSSLSLTLGFSATPFADTIGPSPVRGSMNANINLLHPSYDGSLEILSTDFSVDDIGPKTLDLGPFGKMDIAFSGLKYFLTLGSTPVTNKNFQITTNSTGSFGFNGGKLILTNATGFLGNALGADPNDLDLAARPAVGEYSDLPSPLNGTVDDDGGLFDPDGAEINLPISVTIDVGSGLYLRIDSEFHVGSTAIPEASTFALTGAALVGVLGVARIQRRRS
jgi:hypothetical protein